MFFDLFFMSYIKKGWPDHMKTEALSAKPYFHKRGALTELNGVLRRGHQIISPCSMQDNMIQKIHQGHQGLTKCRHRYNSAIWWPGIGSGVKELIRSCWHCNINQPSQNREPLITTTLPDLPWQKIAADLCDYKGCTFLVIIDYFSRWLEVLNLQKTNSETVISKHWRAPSAAVGYWGKFSWTMAPSSLQNCTRNLLQSSIFNMSLPALIFLSQMALLNVQ